MEQLLSEHRLARRHSVDAPPLPVVAIILIKFQAPYLTSHCK
jgi:hypothetical protein